MHYYQIAKDPVCLKDLMRFCGNAGVNHQLHKSSATETHKQTDRNYLSLLHPGNRCFVTKNNRGQITELPTLQGANTQILTHGFMQQTLVKFVGLFQIKFIQIKDALLNFSSFTCTTNAVGAMDRI